MVDQGAGRIGDRPGHDGAEARGGVFLPIGLLAGRQGRNVRRTVTGCDLVGYDGLREDGRAAVRLAPQLNVYSRLRSAARYPGLDHDRILRVVRKAHVPGSGAVGVDRCVQAHYSFGHGGGGERVAADPVVMGVPLVYLEPGQGSNLEHRRGGGTDAAAHCASVVALAVLDDTTHLPAVGRVNWTDSLQHAELLANAHDLAVQQLGRKGDVHTVAVGFAGEVGGDHLADDHEAGERRICDRRLNLVGDQRDAGARVRAARSEAIQIGLNGL